MITWEVDGDLRQSHKLSLTPDDKDQIWVNFPGLSQSLLLKSLHKLTLLAVVPQPLWALSLEHPKPVLIAGSSGSRAPHLEGTGHERCMEAVQESNLGNDVWSHAPKNQDAENVTAGL